MKFNFTAECLFVGLRRLFFLALIVTAWPSAAQSPVFDKMNSTTTPTGAYSLRRVVNGASRAIEVRSWNGFTADIGFDTNGDLNLTALNAHANSFTAPGPVANPLDGLTASAGSGNGAIYSLRKMRSAYSGAAIQVMNDSNAPQDIGFDGSGNLDVAAIITHIAGGNGFVSIWYDQSGNGYDLTNSDASRYPSIAFNGVIYTRNGRPTLNFASFQNLQVTITPPVTSNITGNAVGAMRNNSSYNRIISITDQTFGGADFDNIYSVDLLSRVGDGSGGTDLALGTYFNDVVLASGHPIADYLDDAYPNYPSAFVSSAIISSGTSTTYVNGDPSTGGATNGTLDLGTNGPVTLSVGDIQSFFAWDGSLSEVTLFFEDIGSTDRQALEGSQLIYYQVANNGFVSKWYDQSGSNDLVQANTIKQPKIVTGGTVNLSGGKPALLFTGAESLELALTIAGPSSNLTANAVAQLNTTTANSYARVISLLGPGQANDYDNTVSADLVGRNVATSNLLGAFNDTAPFNVGGAVGSSVFVASNVINSTGSTLVTNGTTSVRASAGAAFNGASVFAVGNLSGTIGQYQWGGSISEVTLFVSNVKIEDRWVLEANQASYYGINAASWGGAFAWEGGSSNSTSTLTNFIPSPPASISSTTDIVVPRNTTNPLVFAGNLNVRNWAIITGATATNSVTNRTLNVAADIMGGGTLAGSGNLILSGSGVQTITGTTLSLNNLTVNSSSTGVVNNGFVSVSGVLTVQNGGALDADGTSGSLTLKSTVSSDARVAVVTGTPISGDVTVEKYIPNGSGNRLYRYITPSVIGATIADWQGPAETYGFPITGPFSDPSTNTSWPSLPTIISTAPSLYQYTETLSGLIDTRYEAYPTTGNANANPITNGKGYAAFIRQTSDIIIRAKGTLAQGNTDVNVFCHPSPTSDDGWNLIGNPYASAISWANVELTTDNTEVDDAVYLRDNTNTLGLGVGATATYIKSNPGAGNFDGKLAAGQAFFVHANNTGQMTFREADKITDSNVQFIREGAVQIATLKLFLQGASFKDELAIHFPANAKDIRESRFDALKFKNAATVGNFFSQSTDGKDLAINGLAPLTPGQEKVVKLMSEGLKAGSYTISAGMLDSFTTGDIKIELNDKFTGSKYTFDPQHLTYAFSITSESGSSASDRFTVKFAREQMITAVEEFSRQFVTYPNPTKNIIYVEAPVAANTHVKVISAMGALIGNVELTEQDGKLRGQFDLGEKPLGVYLINLSQDGKITTKKIVKK